MKVRRIISCFLMFVMTLGLLPNVNAFAVSRTTAALRDANYQIDAGGWNLSDGWVTGADTDGNLTLTAPGACTSAANTGVRTNCEKAFEFSYDLTFDRTENLCHIIWINEFTSEAGNGAYLLRIRNTGGTLGVEAQFADPSAWINDVLTTTASNPTIESNTLRIAFTKADDGIALDITDPANGTFLFSGVLTHHASAGWGCSAVWFALSKEATVHDMVLSRIFNGVPTAEIIPDPTVAYDRDVANWNLSEGWNSGTDSYGNLTLTAPGACTSAANTGVRTNCEKAFEFSYDLTFDRTDNLCHIIWINEFTSEAGKGAYLLRIRNTGGTLGVEAQFADPSAWINDVLTTTASNPTIESNTLRIAFTKADDGIALDITDPANGTFLFSGVLTHHVSTGWGCSAVWFALSKEATVHDMVLSRIFNGVPTAGIIPDPTVAYDRDATNWNLSDGWNSDTDSYGNLTLTAPGACTSAANTGVRTNCETAFEFSYDLTFDRTEDLCHIIWINEFTSEAGKGAYLLRIRNTGGTLGVEAQFADPSAWINDVLTTTASNPVIESNTLRIAFTKADDVIALDITDPANGTLLFSGVLTHHVSAGWGCSAVWFALSKEATVHDMVLSRIFNGIPDAEPTKDYEKNTDNLILGLGWNSGTDENGNLTLHCETNAEGQVSTVNKVDVLNPFCISYEVTFEADAYTSHSVYINGFHRSGYAGCYLLRFKNNSGRLQVEAQFNDGEWIDGVLQTLALQPIISNNTLRITYEKAEGETGISLTVRNAATDAVMFSGLLSYHEENGWNSEQISLALMKDKGETSLDISKILLDIPERIISDVALEEVAIEDPVSIYAEQAAILYAQITPYASDLASVNWTVTKAGGIPQDVGNNRALYYTFDEAGEYTLAFSATDKYGITKTAEKAITVLPAPAEQAAAPDADLDVLLGSNDGTACAEFLGYMNDMATLPVTFTYNGIQMRGFGGAFEKQSRSVTQEENKITVTTIFLHEDGLLQATVEAAIYPEYNAYDWVVNFQNVGDSNTGSLAALNAADFFIDGANPVFKSISGDKEDLYTPIETDLSQVSSVTRTSTSGWTTHDAFPYFNIETDDGGYMIALGWSGRWRAEFTYSEGRTHVNCGQYALDTYLKPGESVRSPLMAFVKYDVRDENLATNAWRRWYIDCNMPREEDGSLLSPVSVVAVDGNPDYGLMSSFHSESEALDCVRPYVANGVQVDYIWMDAGWYCYSDGGELPGWWYVGTNTVDSNRFENGMADISAYGKENNMKSLLWFEPEFLRMPLEEMIDNFGYQEDWALFAEVDEHTRVNTYLNDLNNEEYRKWMIEHIAYVLNQADIDCYRQDFNRQAGNVWASQDDEGRTGMYENQYVQNYLAYMDTLQTLFPGLTIDSCASGGGRNDLETLRRAVIFHRTDSKNIDNEANQAISQALWKWFPYTNSNNATGVSTSADDTYTLRTAYAPVFKGTLDFRYFDRNDNWDFAKQIMAEWEDVNKYYYGDFYSLTAWDNTTSGWKGWEFFDNESGTALLQLFRPKDSTQAVKTVLLYGLDAEKLYQIKDTDGINLIISSGEQLMTEGASIQLPNARQALVLTVEQTTELPTPQTFGWETDEINGVKDYSGWTADSAASLQADYAQSTGNHRLWKELLSDTENFTVAVTMDLDNASSAYVKVLGITVELDGRGGTGEQLCVKDGSGHEIWIDAAGAKATIYLTRKANGLIYVDIAGEGNSTLLSYTLSAAQTDKNIEIGIYAGKASFTNITVSDPARPIIFVSPESFGWDTDEINNTKDFSGWEAKDSQNLSANYLETVGNHRVWKNLVSGTEDFTVDIDITAGTESSAYIKVLGVILELDTRHGNGNQSYVKLAGNEKDWLTSMDRLVHVKIERVGNVLKYTLNGNGNSTPMILTAEVKEDNENLELGIYAGTAKYENIITSFMQVCEHNWVLNADVSVAPTCTKAGLDVYICSKCAQTKQETVEALGHDLVSHEAKASTCTDIGWDAYETCSRCDYTTYQEIAALGHDLISHEAKAATCTDIGWDAYETCSRCDYTTYQEIAALGHDLVTHEAKAATCTEIGWDAYETCSRCDYTTYQEIAALGHDLVSHEAKAATCTDIGWDAYETCSRCDYTTYQEIAALGHDLVTHEAKAATCTDIGWDAYETCSRCDYTTYQELAAQGHSWDNGVVTTAPTATTEGIMTFTCTACNTTKTEAIPATGEETWVNPFKDVTESDWYYEGVKFAAQNELFNGTSPTTFEPDGDMTRAMLVTVLWRLDGKPAPKSLNSFKDVPSGQWYTEAVAWASENGVVDGVGNNLFEPDGNVTREQIAAIMYRYAGKKGYDTTKRADLSKYPDADQVSSYAKEALSWANAEGLIHGTNNGKGDVLNPKGSATRAQVATILMRYVENIVQK